MALDASTGGHGPASGELGRTTERASRSTHLWRKSLLMSAVLASLGVSCGDDETGGGKGESTEAPALTQAGEADTNTTSASQVAQAAGTFNVEDVAFTFEFPPQYAIEPGFFDSPTRGRVRIGEFSALDVIADLSEMDSLESYIGELRATELIGLTAGDQTAEEYSGIAMQVIEATSPSTSRRTVSYFFELEGKFWTLQCVSTPELAAPVQEACDQMLATITPK